VVLFLRRNICFRQVDQLNARVLLVFPELINQRRPLDIAGVRLDEGAAYTVSGAVDNVYASLVVLLGYSPMLVRTYQWRDQVEYVTDEGFRCGFRLESESKAELHFFLYYGADVPDSIRQMFQGLFETLLAGRDLTVHRLEPVVCRNGHTQDRAIIRQEIAQGRTVMSCPYCAVQVPLLGVEASIDLTGGTATDGDIQHVAADRRARFERALFQLKAFAVRADERQPTCFVSYAWGDPEHERWVERQLSTDLVKAGIAVMLDRWENERTDTSVPQFLERVAAADRIVVVGSRLYREKYESGEPMRSTAVAAAEADLINQRLLDQETRRRSVLPLVVDGPPEQALPPLLQDRIYVDLRDPQHYFTGFFDLALAVHGLSPADPVVAQLREELIAAVTN
jgi:hypothetical protein